jgi:hypothetical protein
MRRKERDGGVVRGEGDGEDCEEQEGVEGTEDVGGAGSVEDWVDGAREAQKSRDEWKRARCTEIESMDMCRTGCDTELTMSPGLL